jgi:rhodanese-related sulfurtransferase
MKARSVTHWSPEDLRGQRAAGEELLVLDVRTGDARITQPYQIPGARWLPLADVVEHAETLPRGAKIVTYCT